MNSDPNTVIHLSGIRFGYPGGRIVLNDLDFSVNRNERIGILAPNGSGKTTLFHIIMGLLKPDAGTIKVFGQSVETEKEFVHMRRKVGLLFQDADDQLFSPTVLEDVAFGPLNMGQSKTDALAVSRKTLNDLGLSGFEDRITFKLSGGEKKLVSLATVLAMSPEVLLLDEPLTGLDQDTRTKLTDILSGLELTYVVISHDIDFLATVTDVLYTMKDGRIMLDDGVHVHRHDHAHVFGNMPHQHK